MIKSLRLESFGRFREKTFAFSPVTLFSGPNEAGKTTLFDAIFDALSSPKATTAAGKILVERYGKDRRAFCEYDGEPLSIAAADFLNLFAVRSGEISLEIEQNSQWANRVKASLFSGGIDAQSVAVRLEAVITGTGKLSLGGEAKRITAELKTMEDEREKAETLRRNCREEEKRISGAGDRMAQAAAESSRLASVIDELEKSLLQQNLLQEEKVLKDILTDAAELRRKKDEQEKSPRLSRAALDDLKKREAQAARLATEAEKAAALEEETLRALAGCAEEKARCEAEKSRGDSVRILAGLLRDTLVPREKLVRVKTRRVWRKPFRAAAGILFIAAAAACVLVPQHWGLVAAVLGGAAVICTALSLTRQTEDDTSLLDQAIAAAREKWQKETGEDAGVRYEEVLAALDRAAERSRAAAEDFSRAAARAAGLEQEAAARALHKKQAGDEAAAALRQLRGLLDEAGTAGITDYAANLEKKENIQARRGELEEKLKKACADYGAASAAELEDALGRRIAEISGKITETELPAQELRAKKNLLQETKTRLDVLRREEKETIESHSLNLGTVRGQLRGLPEKIAACEKGIQEREARLAEIARQLRAAKIARELFNSVAGDSGLMLEQLSREIGELFSALTETGRAVSMKSYSAGGASITDAQGFGRDASLLSAGTRDAFLLAARLVLARKSMDRNLPAIIVLDEPFLALDRQRA
ncbi:MAG: AAA family ATPase, partial [Spirochaetaceae bacterium]|nr:AAA family ATPase [Spirochaetaceae bacterium]